MLKLNDINTKGSLSNRCRAVCSVADDTDALSNFAFKYALMGRS
jgi:hypothetical protein